MDDRFGHQPNDALSEQPPTPTEAELQAMMDASEADIAAGRTVRLEPVLERLHDIAAHIRNGTTRQQR